MFDASRAPNGPYDSSDISAPQELASFGSIAFVPNPLVGVRAEVEEGTQKIVALTFDLNDSTLQVQAFASPKGINLWEEIAEEMSSNLRSQQIQVERHTGPFGVELIAELQMQNDKFQRVRMFGFNGDRWLLRGNISGSAIDELEARTQLENIFRSIVVTRGEIPLPPREPLPLSLPDGAIVPKGF